MTFRFPALAAFVLALCVGAVPARSQQAVDDILRTLNFQQGTITLGADLATVAQTDRFRFLNNADTQTFLTRVWGNPPGTGQRALGMLLPVDSENLSWAVVVSYDPSGYVSDEDAGKIDYDALMSDMRQAVAESNAERLRTGHGSLELLGWAKPPHYDAGEKKLYWAKRLRFDGSPRETLNYEIRILGRQGVLDLNVVAAMDDLAAIDGRVGDILAMVRFNQGNTYAEFVPGVDKAATYGLAGLIAGGVLAKAGFFKGLIALLLASKKLVALVLFGGGAAVWGVFKDRFRRKPAAVPPPEA